MGQRIQTYFGVPFPPWPEEKIVSGSHSIFFAIKGRIPSKKNNQQAVTRRKEAYAWVDEFFRTGQSMNKDQVKQAIRKVTAKMRGNDMYKQFLLDQTPTIEQQRQYWLEKLGPKGLIFPLSKASLRIRFYFAQRYRQDSGNKQQSVQDLLKDCHVIFDDDYTVIDPITVAGRCFAEEIRDNLTYVNLTFKL